MIYILAAAWITLNAHSGGRGGPLYGFEISEFARLLIEPEWAVRAAGCVLAFSALQGAFLLPVRRPTTDVGTRGWTLWFSAAAAGAAIALLWGGVMGAVFAALQLADFFEWSRITRETVIGTIVGSMVIAWLVASPMIAAFLIRGRRETRIGRLAATIFMGTTIEAVAIVPLDIMMRRKTDCYCDTGTFWALSACGTVGLFVLGPAVFLPLLARRRKRYLNSCCDACGYDMSGTMSLPRCPECGSGWRGEK